MLEYLLLAAIAFSAFLILLYRRLWLRYSELVMKLKDSEFRGKSLASKYGRMTEQFIPFLESYPYDEQNFRFIGSPIDGVQFEPDRVVLVEFKAAGSRLSSGQKRVKELVEKGKVEFKEFRIDGVK
jgi:predicted Holliday junction resolvase-like endonuclease